MLHKKAAIVELTPEQLEWVSGGKYGGRGVTEGHGTSGVGMRDRSGPKEAPKGILDKVTDGANLPGGWNCGFRKFEGGAGFGCDRPF